MQNVEVIFFMAVRFDYCKVTVSLRVGSITIVCDISDLAARKRQEGQGDLGTWRIRHQELICSGI